MKRALLVLGSFGGMVVFPLFAFAERGYYGEVPGGMMGYGYASMGSGWGLGLGIFGFILELIFWVFVVWAIVHIVKYVVAEKKHFHTKMEDGALRILRERYAKGEINKEEFDARKKDLEGAEDEK